MFCENCGAKIDEDSKFCENCGQPVRTESTIEFQEEHGEPAEEPKTEDIRDVNELMELGKNGDFLDSPEKTMIFVKPSSSSKEAEKIAEEAGREEDGRADAEAADPEPEPQVESSRPQSQGASQIEGRLRTVRKTAANNAGLVVNNKSGKASQTENLKTEEEKREDDVSVKSGIDPEDEFFVEPRVGAIRKNLPIVDFGEEPAEPEPEEAANKEAAPEPKIPAVPEESARSAVLEETETLKNKGEALAEAEDAETNEAEAASSGEPDQDQETAYTGYEPLFCMACGKALPEGAAFCDACGTRTGAVSPAEIRGRRQSKQGMTLGLLADFFTKPESTIERAADEDACLSGIGFFLLKDVVLAVLAAAFMKRITVSLGMVAPWLTGGDSFGFAAKVFLCAIVMDALWVGLLFGAGYLFRTDCPVKILIGACGTASLLPTALWVIATLLIAFAPFAAMGAIAVTVLVTLIVMTKAAAAAFIPPQDRLLYLMAATTAVYAMILVAAMSLVDIALFA